MMSSTSQMEAYSEAVSSGLYAKKSGLVGKYDNVRRYWEDEITRLFLRPHLQHLIERSQARMRRVRILDMGCGSADGYELLTEVRHREPDLEDVEVSLLTPEILGRYQGIDLNEDLLNQARAIYGNNGKMGFAQADFTQDFSCRDGEKPYDLYFSSYGTCSHHNDDETMIELLANIARQVDDYAVVVCDWIGRYSYEWQTLWTNDLSENRNMDYVVSYIYEPEEREERRDQLQHIYLRLISRQEAEHIVAEASRRAGVKIEPLRFFDRSVFTGRHMDTAEYNSHAQPLRQAVNSLHEANQRTDLHSLLIDYTPKPDFEFLNDYFENLQMCWNRLVLYVDELLHLFDQSERRFCEETSPILGSYPPVMQRLMTRMRQVVEGIGWLKTGLPRENIIEPQLGYALRDLIMELQQGMGCGHGLVGILKIERS
ncbi:MAG: class I SAM-dependent methyltransferase [Pirellulales bacterium]|nr:class I SAM-dependent methyltransferase [Pirellulales bacterium]